jgi:hypothetical protein
MQCFLGLCFPYPGSFCIHSRQSASLSCMLTSPKVIS